jgi:hypothetical protein
MTAFWNWMERNGYGDSLHRAILIQLPDGSRGLIKASKHSLVGYMAEFLMEYWKYKEIKITCDNANDMYNSLHSLINEKMKEGA